MKKIFLWGCLVIALTLLIELFFFNGYLLTPNKYIFPFGGDGYYIAYHLNFHTSHGDGLLLNSMNYPEGELIFMTDAQAILSIVLNQLHNLGLPVAKYVVGIMNALNYYLIPLCTLFLFLIFKELKTSNWFALLAALFIGLLSPQINRIVIGHYGLGYPFLIPMVIYWILRAKETKSWYRLTIGVSLTVFIFGLNNLYLLLICGGLMMGSAVVLYFENAQEIKNWRLSIISFLAGAIPLGFAFTLLKTLDQVEDRVKVPYGFLSNLDLLRATLFPPGSFVFKTLKASMKLKSGSLEGAAYLGIIPAFILLILFLRFLKNRKFSFKNIAPNPRFSYLFILSIGFLLFAMHFPFYGSIKEWVYKIPIIPQFRAQQRFIWVFYYCFTIMMAHWGYIFYNKMYTKQNGKAKAIGLLIVGSLIWSNDVYHYLKYNAKGIFYKNPFTAKPAEQMKKLVADYGLSKDNYQGIYFLPTMNSWSDKILHPGSWHTYYPGLQICVASGLPMIDLMLSRVSVSQMLEKLQLVSHPLIERELFQHLPNDKPILLLVGKKAKLHPNETWLIHQADTLVNEKDFVLLKYAIPKQENKEMLYAQEVFKQNNYKSSTVDSSGFFIFEHYDDVQKELAFFGKGARHIKAKAKQIWQSPIPKSWQQKEIEASLWIYVGHEKFSLPFITLQALDKDGKEVAINKVWGQGGRDVQHGWVRIGVPLKLNDKAVQLKIISAYQFSYWMDELLVKEKSQEIIWTNDGQEKYFSFDNFLVGK